MNERKNGDDRYLKHHPLFYNLSEEELDTIRKSANLHILRRGKKLVINQIVSNRIYFLVDGKIKITDSPADSDLLVKDVLYAGEMFGNISLNGHYTEEYAESLLHNTLVYCFSVTDFKNLLRMHHQLALNYANHISRKLQLLKERYAIWTRHDTKTRLVYLLYKWSLNEGTNDGDTITLDNFLPVTDLADILTVSRQFLHQLFKELKEAGLVQHHRKRIEVKRSLFDEMKMEISN